uniref:Shisa family member 4 n=1 Tax=Scleropages formosus TaxID=113540 RepID=A0A8C9T2K9_SCLFO
MFYTDVSALETPRTSNRACVENDVPGTVRLRSASSVTEEVLGSPCLASGLNAESAISAATFTFCVVTAGAWLWIGVLKPSTRRTLTSQTNVCSYFSSIVFESVRSKMLLAGVALPVFAAVLSACHVSADEDCLWYVDKNGTWRNGFDCPFNSFCCGNCHHRYCCLDVYKMISEREQKRCMLFHLSPTTIAGIASSLLLFVAIIATLVCCFMCSCCYLYQRRQQHGRTSYEGQQIPLASYPVDPTYNTYGKPMMGGADPQNPGYPVVPQYYPGMPQQYPIVPQFPSSSYPPVDLGIGQPGEVPSKSVRGF